MTKEGTSMRITLIILGLVITTFFAVLAIAWAGGSRVGKTEEKLVNIVGDVSDNKGEINHLKVEVNEAKLRDVRIQGQYEKIASHMVRQTEQNTIATQDRKDMNKAVHKIEIEISKWESVKETN